MQKFEKLIVPEDSYMEGCLGFRWEGPQLPARPHWRWDVTALLICQMRWLLVFLLNDSRLGTFVSFIFP